MKDIVEAPFVPTMAEILTTSSNANLLTENPILASALLQIFPYFLLIDNFLEICTWTNEDPFQNLLVVMGYSIVVWYWNFIAKVMLPVVFAYNFCSVVWRVNSVIIDSRVNEKPTIDEVINTLNNITVRMGLLLRPMKMSRFGRKQLLRLSLVAVILSPVHWALLHTVMPIRRYLWIVGIFVLTHHSPWAYSVRRLVWRSVYVRVLVFYITGLDVNIDKRHQQKEASRSISATTINTPATSDIDDLDTSLPMLSDFKVVKKVIVSPITLKQVVKFEILENERRWFGLGWSHFVLPGDRPNYCFEGSLRQAPSVEDNTNDDFPFPIFANDLYSYHWNWIDPKWSLDLEYSKHKDKQGWLYHDSNWENSGYEDGFSMYTRSRRWVRTAELLIDKEHSVMDGK